jgi:hypothetical protein
MSATEIPFADFQRLWLEQDLPAKLRRGQFQEIIAYQSRAHNPWYKGGEFFIIKLLTPGGQHIATVHRIVLRDGSVPHEHPKDYTRRDCTRVFPSEPQD